MAGIGSSVSTTTPDVLARLGGDHARIAGVISELTRAVDSLSASSDPQVWATLLELMEFQTYFADRIHHPLEDRIFDRALHKGLTPTERHLVFKNLGQHQEILAMTRRLMADVQSALKGGVVDEAEFVEQVAQYVSLQRRHMRFEETHLFGLLEARFNNQDWNDLHDDMALDEAERAVREPADKEKDKP